jgi:DNA-directed RNA polymerase specialized sigma24 family protein
MSAKFDRKEYPNVDAWDEVLLGDKELFRKMSEPFVPALLEAARQQIKRGKIRGNLPDTVRPEELVSETLVEAWLRRYSRWNYDSLKEWLLATQRWALHLLVLREKDWEKAKAISLEETVPSRLADDDYDEWDWITPQFNARDCWRDVIADENSLSHAV